jgi:hypothetical protein
MIIIEKSGFVLHREYSIYYWGPGFLAVPWFLLLLLLLLRSSFSSQINSTHRKTEKERQLADGRGEREGAKSYEGEKAWHSTV